MTGGSQIWSAVATLDELWEGEMKSVQVPGLSVLLLNIDGRVYAYEDQCPHLGNPLSEGLLDGSTLTCAAHEWVFDCRVGCGINPAAARLRPIPVQVDGETIRVGLETIT